MLKAMVLRTTDIGPDYTQEVARLQTNEDAAKARPDTEQARQQYREWDQVLAYNVQFGAPPTADLVFSDKTARVLNTATLYNTPVGAASALAFVRGLSPGVVANFLINDSSGTRISDTQVVKDIVFPAKGDGSFSWRISGKATFENGFTVNFVADSVFVRVGRVTGNVTTVALGQSPNPQELNSLVDKFVERVRANG